MQSTAKTPAEYVNSLPEERKIVIENIRKTVLDNLPKGFEETMSYGMLGYVVPHSVYPDGYHCDPKTPLPFISVASQKNFIAFYHMGIYADENLLNWFVAQYPKHCKTKLDMGKSCIRFKKMNDIPLELLGQLVTKMSVQDWISLYEKNLKR